MNHHRESSSDHSRDATPDAERFLLVRNEEEFGLAVVRKTPTSQEAGEAKQPSLNDIAKRVLRNSFKKNGTRRPRVRRQP